MHGLSQRRRITVDVQGHNDARRQGWIYINQETALGMASLAVPIRANGRVRYGLSTSATLTYDGPTIVDRYLPDLLKAAEAMRRFLETRN